MPVPTVTSGHEFVSSTVHKSSVHGTHYNGNGHSNGHASHSATSSSQATLLSKFVKAHDELEAYRQGESVVVDGQTLSIAAVVATARFGAGVTLDESPEIRQRVQKSRDAIVAKVQGQKSVYGVSTGFGGSADTRTNDPILLGHAFLQHQQVGVLPSQTNTPLAVLPLSDPLASTSMPESWVRGTILIRMNSLIRGHSGVRWELVEKMRELLRENITPLIPLRGSISASGDLSPLSYIASTLIGNPNIRVFDGPAVYGARQIVPSNKALAAHNVEPLPLSSKEHLGMANGTAVSASVASLALHEATHLALLAQVCTAMGVEALLGSQGSFDPFIHEVARPHPGQVEVAANICNLLSDSRLALTHEEEVTITEDAGELRQDRYPLRTSAQFLGPQIEDILSALAAVTLECNSTTDNPLIDGETGNVHHGGNFQAMSITNAMEKTRLAIHHIGKLLFAQSTELMNPMMNRGLPPNLASTDPSHNYFGKGIDIHTAAYVAELGHLASPVSTHIQSAEMHNQAVNSMALVSARATINSLEVLSLLTASYLYVLCQALDLRAMQMEFEEGMKTIVKERLDANFDEFLSSDELNTLFASVFLSMRRSFEATSNMDINARMITVAAASTTPIVDFCTRGSHLLPAMANIQTFRSQVAEEAAKLMKRLRIEYIFGERGPTPASKYLGRTKAIYEFVRVDLGILLHGKENLTDWGAGAGMEELSIGQNISLIHEAIRDGKMQSIVVDMIRPIASNGHA